MLYGCWFILEFKMLALKHWAKNIILTTDIVPEEERPFFWQDFISSNVIGLDIKHHGINAPFHGSIQGFQTSGIRVANLKCTSGQDAIRSKKQISKSCIDDYLFCFQKLGIANLLLENRVISCPPGTWVLCDCSRPYTWSFPAEHNQMVFKIPKRILKHRLMSPDQSVWKTVSGHSGLGKIAWQLVHSVWDEINNNGLQSGSGLESIIIELLATTLNDATICSKTISRHEKQLLEIKSFINREIRNPKLSVELIADKLNMSTRHMHMLFRGEETTIAQFIRELRLERCKTDMENQSCSHRSLTEIAFSWGFNNSSHFTKLFKKYYGCPPKQFRVGAQN
jgi:AraC-like DNA-binding protein